MSFLKRLQKILRDQRGFGILEVAVPALVEAVGSIALEDVGIGAAIGGLESGLTGGNIFEGAAFGAVGGGLADVGSSLYAGSELESGVNSLTSGIGDAFRGATSGIGDALNSAGNSISGLFGGSDSAAGGITQDGLESQGGITSATGSAIQGTTPTASGAVGGGGFTAPSAQLTTGADPAIASQLGGTQAVSGATTPGATSLGSVGGDSGSNFSGINTIGQAPAEPATADNFGVSGGVGSGGSSGGLVGSPSNSGIESATGGVSSGGFEGGGGLPNAGGPLAGTTLPSGPTDSLGVQGGVAPSASTGASSLTSSLDSGGSQFADLNTIGSSGASGASSGDFGSQITGALTNPSNLKYALPAGELVNTLISGPQKLPSNAQPLTAGGAVEGPLQQTEQQSLNAYNSQTLTPGQQAQIDQYTQQQQNALYQQLAGSGVTNPQQDSRYIQGMQQIQQQAQAMKQQLLGTDLSAGEGAAGQAGQDLLATSELQNKSDEDYQQAIQAAISSFSQMEGGNSLGSIEKLLGG